MTSPVPVSAQKITLELVGDDLRPMLNNRPITLGEKLWVLRRDEVISVTVSLQYDAVPEDLKGWKITPTATLYGRQISILGMLAQREPPVLQPVKSSRARDLSRQRRRKAVAEHDSV